MATTRVPQSRIADDPIDHPDLISYDQALAELSADERFRATVYAMNTLLMEKGIYSADEFSYHFRQSAQKQIRKRLG